LGLEEDEMHPQPWNLPDCSDLEELEETPYDYFVRLDPALPRFKPDNFLRNVRFLDLF